jgi:uncharacterized protein YdeI (YjbR/CyaY-like superfamily)
MPAVTPRPDRIRPFPDAASFEAWLSEHHAREPELWLQIHKKGSGLATVTYAEAVDVALCWGWIDGQKKSLDELSFLQRFTPRGPKSVWSAINVGHVARLTEAGRMTPHGQRHVDAAKRDGRWDAAYSGSRTAEVPEDFAAALAADPAAQAAFNAANSNNRYAIYHRLISLRTPAGREKAVLTWIDRLKRGDLPYP